MPIKDLIDDHLTNERIENNVFNKIANDQSFIYFSQDTKDLMKKYPSNEDGTIIELWKAMVIDAICILKMNDSREKLYKDTSNIIESDKSSKVDEDNTNFMKAFSSIRKMSSYGIESMDKYFNDFVEYESVLYGTDNYYRDHVNHVLQVWAIGISILYNDLTKFSIDKSVISEKDFHFEIDPKSEILEKQKTDSSENDYYFIFSKSEIFAMWTIIALCHDLGYPIEKTSKINEKARNIINHFGCINFEELNFSFGLFSNFIVSKFLDIISSKVVCINRSNDKKLIEELNNLKFRTSIQSKYRDKLSKTLEEFKHGVFSSLLIFKNLTYFLETDFTYSDQEIDNEDGRQFAIRKEILRAISAHTCPKLYHVNLNTLSFLLILCDELQEWGRPNFDDFRSSGVPNDIKVHLKKFDLAADKQDVEIVFEFTKKTEDDLSDYIKKRFQHMHHLLRSAKDDKLRKVKFVWIVKFQNNITYQFIFDSDENSFDLVNCKKNEDKLDIYSIKKHGK